jgi:heme exporter protein A
LTANRASAGATTTELPPASAPGSALQDLTPAIRAVGLSKAFGSRVALRDLTFDIAPGERVAVLGPNGAGKTTLLRVLALLAAPTSGRLEIGGYAADRDAAAIRPTLGAVLHESLLYSDLTVLENLQFFARLYGLHAPSGCFAALLERLGLTAQAGLRVKHLSRGQRQRASLARALVHNPTLLLLDEPDTGQDPASLKRVERELLAAPGRTILFSTHHAAHALAVATRVFVLTNGAGYDLGPAAVLTASHLQAALAEAAV